MVFFNDPVPIPNAAVRVVDMAVVMRESAVRLIADWRGGRELGSGAGIAQGYATLGQIGFSERSGSARCATSPPGFVLRPRTAKSCSLNASIPR